ncbi:MAG: SURF1 family protein [Limnobacter sp.]|nr:SURF1 family protein [Limnobacter sp.]
MPTVNRKGVLGVCAALGLAALTFKLGLWQTERAHQKQVLLERQQAALLAQPVVPQSAKLSMASLEYRRVGVKGRFLPQTRLYVDNRQFQGLPAVQAIEGFQPEGADFVIPVDRGYVLRNPSQPRRAPEWPQQVQPVARVATMPTPAPTPTLILTPTQAGNGGAAPSQPLSRPEGNTTDLHGILLSHFPRSAELRGLRLSNTQNILKAQENGYRVWSNFSLSEFEALAALPVSNYVVTQQLVPEQTSASHTTATQPLGNGGSRVGQQPLSGFYRGAIALNAQIDRHRGYALQWFGLTAVLVCMVGFLVFRSVYRHARASTSS